MNGKGPLVFLSRRLSSVLELQVPALGAFFLSHAPESIRKTHLGNFLGKVIYSLYSLLKYSR